jgi:catechol 2,3-dioxygenase-like lactoylglutathione lyase family enzyme
LGGLNGGMMRLNQVTVPSTDVAASVRFYTTLGLEQIVGGDSYARFVCPDGEATFSVDEVTEVGRGRAPVVYFECEHLDATVGSLKDAGLVFESGPTDQAWLWREARLMDPDGNEICLYFAGDNRLDPPWKLPTP